MKANPNGPRLSAFGCGRCHTCGEPLRLVLDGEEWCDDCQTYRRYRSHGWGGFGLPGCCPDNLGRRETGDDHP